MPAPYPLPPSQKGKKGTVGHPEKLTPELQADFIQYLRLGAAFEVACAMVGISKATFYVWMKRGHVERAAGAGVYLDFLVAVRKAVAEHEVGALARLARAAQGTKATENTPAVAPEPKWDAWILERRYRARYSKLERVELTGEDGGPVETVQHDAANLSDRINKLLARARASARSASEESAVDGDDGPGGAG